MLVPTSPCGPEFRPALPSPLAAEVSLGLQGGRDRRTEFTVQPVKSSKRFRIRCARHERREQCA